jgi:uncharacterized SAM-binding protein YcdF (DUF218 family)
MLPILGALFVFFLTSTQILMGLGTFLASPADADLNPADAIVPLGGSSPFRAMEAAALFHRGFAPRVLVPKPVEGLYTREMEELGLIVGGPQKKVFHTLQRLQVPSTAITLSRDTAANTEEELESIGRHALSAGYQRLILVTSWYHARRVRLIWKKRFSTGPAAAIHILSPERSSKEGIDPSAWWRSEYGRQLVLHEYLGIVQFLLRHSLTFRRA